MDTHTLVEHTVRQFAIYGEFEKAEAFGSGHINDTYRSVWNQAGTRVRYTHQRINDKVFTKPCEVMENIGRVTLHIAQKLLRDGVKDRSRRVLTLVPSRDGKDWVQDSKGSWWRTYLFIENSHMKASPLAFRNLAYNARLQMDFDAALAYMQKAIALENQKIDKVFSEEYMDLLLAQKKYKDVWAFCQKLPAAVQSADRVSVLAGLAAVGTKINFPK